MRLTKYLCILLILNSSISQASGIDEKLKFLNKPKSKDIIMHRMEIAVEAIKESRYKLASEQLDIILLDIESFYSGTEDAKKARSLWVNEGRKHFKGEPYERAMAYYYRGLLYLIDGDYDNAHASFKGGQLQDAMAEGHDQQTDFVLLMVMQAWSAKLMGQKTLAEQALADINNLRPDIQIPSPATHSIVIAETGLAPRKIRDGVSGERLVFRRGKKFNDRYASVKFKSDNIELTTVEDIYYQASTRGARAIDFVNRGKAQFKQTWADSNSSIAEIGSMASNFVRVYNDLNSPDNGTGFSANISVGTIRSLDHLSLAAATISLLSSKVKAKADIRTWSNLPDQVHIGFIPKKNITQETEFTLMLFDDQYQEIKPSNLPLNLSGDGEKFFWVKVH